MLEDLNSTNGIFVKSKRVRRHYLNDGDVVLIGKHEIMYVDERAARARNTLSDTMPELQALRAGRRRSTRMMNEDSEPQQAPLKQ